MKRTWTIIGVADVPLSFKWYQALFGQPATLPAHDYFGQILDSDGTVLLCLHKPARRGATPQFEHSNEGVLARDPDGYYVTISSLSGD